MFGDYSFNDKRCYEQSRRFNQWLQNNINDKSNIVIIEIGAGNYISTVRRRSEEISSQYNAKLIRINPRDYQVPKGHISISLNSLEALTK